MSDDQEIIQKASLILENYNVGKNLTYFVDNVHNPDADGLVWDHEFGKTGDPKPHRARRFTLRGRVFEMLATENKRSYDGDSAAKFSLTVDGQIVLTSEMVTAYDGGFAFRSVPISPNKLKQVKIGPWMEELQEARKLSEAAEEIRRLKREAATPAATASKFDLGKYGDE